MPGDQLAPQFQKPVPPSRSLCAAPPQISLVGDMWGLCLSALESDNAEFGRIIDTVACKRRTRDTAGEKTFDSFRGKDGKTKVRERCFTKTGIQTVAEHYAVSMALRRDDDLRIDRRETARMRLGADGRMTGKRSQPKLVKVYVDPDWSLFDEIVALMNAADASASATAAPAASPEMPSAEDAPQYYVRQKRR